MNILLFEQKELSKSGTLSLTDHRAEHILKILKLNVGRRLRVGLLNGKTGTGVITQIGSSESTSHHVNITVENLEKESPPASRMELILALPRPKSLKRCLRAAACLGIKSIHLIHSARVDKSYWQAPVLRTEELREALIDGLSIARDTQMPIVRLHRFFKPFVEDIAPHLIQSAGYVASPAKEKAIRSHNKTGSAMIQVAIGPEGGFSDYEVQLFKNNGFETLSLGPRIYSVECALPLATAAIETL